MMERLCILWADLNVEAVELAATIQRNFRELGI